MVYDSRYFREKAIRCRFLLAMAWSPTLATELVKLARDFESAAEALEMQERGRAAVRVLTPGEKT